MLRMKLTTFLRSLDAAGQSKFLKRSGTTESYLFTQVLPGHRSAGIKLMWRMVLASRAMFPDDESRWLDLQTMYVELLERQANRNTREKVRAKAALTSLRARA